MVIWLNILLHIKYSSLSAEVLQRCLACSASGSATGGAESPWQLSLTQGKPFASNQVIHCSDRHLLRCLPTLHISCSAVHLQVLGLPCLPLRVGGKKMEVDIATLLMTPEGSYFRGLLRQFGIDGVTDARDQLEEAIKRSGTVLPIGMH